MNPIKFVWKNKGTRIWLLVSVGVLVFLFVASMILTQVEMIRGTFNILFGGDRAVVTGNAGLYTSDYGSKAETLAAAKAFNASMAEEGITLLKNEDNALPLSKGAKVSVFGKNSVNLVYGGSGSGVGRGETVDLYAALDEAEIDYNRTMKSFYEDSAKSPGGRGKNPAIGDVIAGFGTGETPVSYYTPAVRGSYADYHDAAIVVFSRIGGEGFDLPRTMKTSYDSKASKISGARSMDDHYLQLDENETGVLKEACANFDKVIVVLNCATSMELGFLDDETHYAYNKNIKAAIWMGNPGSTGTLALGRVLNGTVNPSGHTVDTYARNFKDAPSYKNFGNNSAELGNNYTVPNSSGGVDATDYYFVEYEEGLNVGYRYYETRGYEEEKKDAASTWYADNVVFPFGYGLSYTSFDLTLESVSIPEGTALQPSDEIVAKVKVTNTKDRAGKEVVQLYYTAPYNPQGRDNAVEKSYVVLGDFAKTKLLRPGESDVVEMKLPVSDMKSYDYSDANGNRFKGYELEKGDYQLHISRDAHTPVKTLNYTVEEEFFLDDTGESAVVNRFDDVSAGVKTLLSRADYSDASKFPTTPTDADRKVSADFISSLKYKTNDAGKPWETTDMPTQANNVLAKDAVEVTCKDVIGKDFADPLWETLLNQLTVDQMARLIGTGAYGTVQIENIDKPLTIEPDGPGGFTNFMAEGGAVYDTCFYACECVIGATWNKELAYEMGKMVGNEGLIGDEKGSSLPYSGWYAPAVNIHRSPFSGRNWEYYSEDAYLSGALAAQVCLGAQEKGVYTFVKHFAVNDQETNRDSEGILVWADEQTMREIYLKPFEIAVKHGKTTAMMSSFNRLGTVWAGGSYPLLTEVLRNEWGFKGMVVTDYNLLRYMNTDQMIRAGGDLVLNQGNKAPTTAKADATQVTAIRKAAKNILYTIVNSNAMNSLISGYRLPIWMVLMICADAATFVGFAAWGFFIIRGTLKKNKTKEKKAD